MWGWRSSLNQAGFAMLDGLAFAGDWRRDFPVGTPPDVKV